MPRTAKHTFEQCQAAATGCTSRKQFRKKAPSEYHTALRQGWLDAICPRGPQSGPWTKERVAEVAKLYATRSAMKVSPHQIALKAARRNGWEDVLPPVGVRKNPANTWTKELCLRSAQRYEYDAAWRRGDYAAYRASVNHGWYEECTAHMERRARPSENNVVYCWAAEGVLFNGTPVYKVGVTSLRCGTARIAEVSKSAGCKATMVFHRLVADARALESEMLAIGVDPLLCPFDGSTEFRAYTEAELQEVLRLANSHTLL